MQTDCVILGGGAAGLCAAAALGRSGLRVTLLEKLPRVGKKLLATGNGRCNLSNTDMQPAYYGDSAPFVRKVYEATPPQEVSDFFTSLGLMTAVEDGRIYPRTMAASSVLDVLRMACERYGIQMMTDCEVTGFTPSRRGGWSVQLADGSGIFSSYVIDAMGGSAAPAMGTDGSGVRLLAQLGHEATPLYPALVQLKCSHPALKGLKGIRVQAHLTLFIEGNAAAQETGELLFADYGVSGLPFREFLPRNRRNPCVDECTDSYASFGFRAGMDDGHPAPSLGTDSFERSGHFTGCAHGTADAG